MIVQAAISPSNELWRLYGILGPPSQNQENNLDFSLETAAGKESLELMEIALLEKNGRYSAAPLTYNQGIVADKIISQIEKKSKRYGALRFHHDKLAALLYGLPILRKQRRFVAGFQMVLH